MCGFVGVLSCSAQELPREPVLERMRSTIGHRGPDGRSIFADDQIAMAFVRLAVIDRDGGDQPMASEDEQVRLVFNGELYNYKELRAQLEAQGRRFRTRSDTEVLLRCYQEWGDECLSRLRGIFAFAVWDARRRGLLLARDRSGVKPIYLQRDHQAVRFASEIKAILADPSVPRGLDLAGCFGCFESDSPLEPTAFRGVTQLGPGWAVWLSPDAPDRPDRSWRYWSHAAAAGLDAWSEDDEALIGRFREELDAVVSMQMGSDAPIGACLSGGLDSAAVVACMARHSTEPVRTYTSVVDPDASDDAWMAFALSRQLAVRPRFLRFSPTDHALALVPLVAWAAEGDFDLGFAARLQLAVAARSEGLKVLLTGQGADELLTGYHPSFEVYESTAVRQALRRRLVDGRRFDLAGVVRGHPPDDDATTRELIRNHAALGGYLLRFEDRMGMLAGIEARVPFLDHGLIELCARIPPSRRSRLLSNKHILRAAMAGWVPDLIRNRPKHAFNAGLPPMTRLLDQGARDVAGLRDLISTEAVKARGYFEPANVEQLRNAGHYHALDGVLVVHLLDELFVKNFDPRRFGDLPRVPVEDTAVDETHVRFSVFEAAAHGLSGATVPALQSSVVRIGNVTPTDPNGALAARPSLLSVTFDHGEQRFIADADLDAAPSTPSLLTILRLVDGKRSYADIAREIQVSLEAVLGQGRILHRHGILAPPLQ